jgi:aryl-alcohol dehydrogenase-like predicted oxidoreductase
MNKRRLGRTGLMVSEIGLGALEIGRDWGIVDGDLDKPDQEQAIRVLEHAVRLGINLIDSARAYVLSEERIGKALSLGRIDRDQIILATKAGEHFDEGTGSVYDYSYEAILLSLEESLEVLRTRYVDLMQIHSAPLDVVRAGEAMRALKEAQRAGRCRFAGASFDDPQACLEAISTGDYDTIQISYNLLERETAEPLIAAAARADVGVLIKQPLAQGLLTSKHVHASAHGRERVAPYLFLEREGQTLAQGSLRFALSNSGVHSVLCGSKRPEHLKANVEAGDGQGLSTAELERVAAVALATGSGG